MGGFYSVNTTPNTWAYQMFPGGTPYSIAMPQDSIGNWNDIQLTNFDYAVDSLERNSVAMMKNVENLYKQYQAQIAQWNSNVYPNISSNTNMTIPGMSAVNPGVTPGGYASKIEDSQVAAYISRLGNDPIYGPELKKTVTLDNGTKVTYLKRLDDLIKDRLTSESPLLSDADFAKIKEIAGKLAKTGKITKEDFLTLKKIVDNNKGELATEAEARAEKEAEEEARVQEEDDKKAKEEAAKAPVEKPYGYQQTVETKAVVDTAAETFFDAMDGAGTNLDKMDSACENVSQYNVIEVIDAFAKKNHTHSGESLIEMIMDDFSNYGGGRSQKWYHFGCTDDNAKPYVETLATAMNERVADLKELKNANGEQKLSAATIKRLDDAVKTLSDDMAQKANDGKDGSDMSKEAKQSLVTKFTALVNAIKAAENEAYGRGHQDKVYIPSTEA